MKSKYVLVAALAGTMGCQEAPEDGLYQNREAVQRTVNASVAARPVTFEGHDRAFFRNLHRQLILNDIDHEDCELLADAFTNPNPGPILSSLSNLPIVPDVRRHPNGSNTPVSGSEYITEIVRHCRTPNRYQSYALLSRVTLLRFASIVEEYMNSHTVGNTDANKLTRMGILLQNLRREIANRDLLERANQANFYPERN